MKFRETRQVNRALLAVIAAALAAGVASCGERHPQPTTDKSGPGAQSGAGSAMDRAASQAGQRFEQAGRALDDATVTAKVKSALIAEPDLKALSINVDTMTGIVTLKGTTDSAEAKKRAEQVASGVEGVRSVRNELVVVRG